MQLNAEVLWRLNSEYRHRLSNAQNAFQLLEQLLRHWTIAADGLAILRRALLEFDTMATQHRAWRYQYFYSTADDKRMVQDEPQVQLAYNTFMQMSAQHHAKLTELQALLSAVPRPDAHMTSVSNGDDLWPRAEQAFAELSAFDGQLRALS
jgi:hypothetical protein